MRFTRNTVNIMGFNEKFVACSLKATHIRSFTMLSSISNAYHSKTRTASFLCDRIQKSIRYHGWQHQQDTGISKSTLHCPKHISAHQWYIPSLYISETSWHELHTPQRRMNLIIRPRNIKLQLFANTRTKHRYRIFQSVRVYFNIKIRYQTGLASYTI